MPEADRIFKLLGKAKKLAQEYRRLTGKPLGITGEVARRQLRQFTHGPDGRDGGQSRRIDGDKSKTKKKK
jgi:hypothetical protein